MKKTQKIAYIIFSSFIFVFALNIIFFSGFVDPVLNVFSADISSMMNFDIFRFAYVSGALVGETGVLSGAFFIVSKKFL